MCEKTNKIGEMFMTYRVHSVSMEDIARQLGISKKNFISILCVIPIEANR